MGLRSRFAVAALAAGLLAAGLPAGAGQAPAGQVSFGLHVSLAPTWFDPAEAPGIITPYLFYYLLHDSLVKPLPEANPAPALARSWSASEGGMVHEFVLRDGVRFHNNEPVTAEDVKFSFER